MKEKAMAGDNLEAAVDWSIIAVALLLGVGWVIAGEAAFGWWIVPAWGKGVTLGFLASAIFGACRRYYRSMTAT